MAIVAYIKSARLSEVVHEAIHRSRGPTAGHLVVLERAQQREDRKPVDMTLRRCTVEHMFGTLKHWIGSTLFLTKLAMHVRT